VIRGALAAAVTPLRDGGAALDEDAFAPLVEFLAAGGLDGIFALGTTGEGILLSTAERQRAAELFLAASAGRLGVVVHCGAQTTAETVALASHAAEAGADGVAVVGPPYYAFDEDELLAHFAAVARACAPVPFFLYEFASRAGYAIPLSVVERLRAQASNLAGLKVSDTPFDAVEPYLVEGLDVFVGSEPLFPPALERGAVGSVSGLATAFPEMIAALVRQPTAANTERVTALRDAVSRIPFTAAMKVVLGLRGLPVQEDVRPPLRALTAGERDQLERMLPEWLESPSPAPAR
jgi:dihydrodipicolinate synthase/N-acetylneuraminate lyase